jgi:hypothetical protein
MLLMMITRSMTPHFADALEISHTRRALPFPHVASSRRLFFLSLSVSATAPTLLFLQPAQARTIDVGVGGVDVLTSTPASADALYPASMQGPWTVQRVVTSVEGDVFQAETAWRALGGSGDFKKTETFPTRYLLPVPSQQDDLDNTAFMVLDRGYERQQRRLDEKLVEWSVAKPNVLTTDKVENAVVQRTVEPPTDNGFGYNELYLLKEGQLFQRAARVQRRYRRAFDDAGNRVVEGLEIQKTYRVLDGVAGTEFPTSTLKSMIRMKRPADE